MRPTRPMAPLALLAAAALCAGADAGIVYQQDFENPSTIGWDLGGPNFASSEALGNFSKRSGNNETTLTVDTMNNQVYTLVFDLYLFDEWSGNSSRWGQNTFTVRAEGTEILRDTFSNTGVPGSQTYAEAPDAIGQFGFGAADDSVHRDITLAFTAHNPRTTLRFMGQGLGQLGDNSWALDNVRVYLGDAPVAPSVPGPGGAALAAVGAGFLGLRRRRVKGAAVVAAAGAVAAGANANANAGIVHQQDFENAGAIGSEWSSAGTEHAAAFTRFSKRRTNETLSLTLDTMAGQMYSLVFDLYLFDSWDGSNPTWGQDRFNVRIGEEMAFSELLDNAMNSPHQTYRNADEVGQMAFGTQDADRDSIYRGVALDFVAADETTKIQFFGSGLQSKSDESWGIDNVSVAAIPAPAGALLLAAGAVCATRRRREAE